MPVTSDSLYLRKVLQENGFIVTDTKSVTSGGTFNIHLKNPSDSNTTFWIFESSISSTGSYNAEVYDSFSSAPSGGNDITVQNLLLGSDNGSPDSGLGVANKDVSFTSTGSHALAVGGGGAGGQSIGSASNHTEFAMEPGREIVIEVTNTASETNDYGIAIVYAQIST